MSANADDWIGQALEQGRYQVIAPLGAGSMGRVYRTRDQKLDTDVVIKVPHRSWLDDPQALARFRREIRTLIALSHPHILKVYDLGEHDGLPFVVMQYLPGGNLQDRLSSGPDARGLPSPREKLQTWLADIAAALDYLHNRGWVHRDVKPANVLFDAAGRAYLGDFGIARAALAGAQSAALTTTGQLLGTPLYMAPEVGLRKDHDGRLDQYSLAATVYHWVCGRPPFEGPPMVVLSAHLAQPPVPPHQLVPGLPEALSAALLQALAKDPAHRFPDCTTFTRAVLTALAAPTPGTVSGPPGAGTSAAAPLLQMVCPSCRTRLQLPGNAADKVFRCPHCRNLFRVPGRSSSLSETAPSVRNPTLPGGARPAAVVARLLEHATVPQFLEEQRRAGVSPAQSESLVQEFQQGLRLLQQRQAADAESAFVEVARAQPRSAVAATALAAAQLAGDNQQAARQSLARASRLAPENTTLTELLPPLGLPNAPRVAVEAVMYRDAVAVAHTSAGTYALLKLTSPPALGKLSPALNLALVVDVSGSMYEEDGAGITRLDRLRAAVLKSLRTLGPDDRLAVIAFAQNARLALPSTWIAERATIEEVIQEIDSFDVCPDSTALDKGLRVALNELRKHAGAGRLSQAVVVTDGETSVGEGACRELARQAARDGIYLTLIGLGTEWDVALLKELAKLSAGRWHYIDVNQALEVERIVLAEFNRLAAVGFPRVAMHLRPAHSAVTIRRLRQVFPSIEELQLLDLGEQHVAASLSPLAFGQSAHFLLDLGLPAWPPGKHTLARVEVTWYPGSGRSESAGPVPLVLAYTAAGAAGLNPEVARYLREAELCELNFDLQQVVGANDRKRVEELVEKIQKVGALIGPAAERKTNLARQLLQEFKAEGRVSKKTRLTMDDALRLL